MMSRRGGGGDKIFSKRKEEKNKKAFNRSKFSLNQLEKILISCEGTKTEPFYLTDFFRFLVKTRAISPVSFVIAKHRHTDPLGVLNDLLDYKEDGQTSNDFQHKWIVIDRDEPRVNGGGHTLVNYNNAISKAKSLNIGVAFSNPSFELWYLLHYQYRNTAIDRDSVNTELGKIIDYEKNAPNMFDTLLSSQNIAVNNAKRLINDCTKNTGNCNPSTNMHSLVEFLNDFKKNLTRRSKGQTD